MVNWKPTCCELYSFLFLFPVPFGFFFCLFFCRDSVFDTDKKLMGAVSQVRTSRPGVTLLSVVGVLACSHLGWCFLGKRVFASFF